MGMIVEFVLRVVAMGATLAAAIVMGTNKQTEIVPVQVNSTLTVNAPVPAKYHYSSAFVFFVVANALASGYTLLSIFMLFLKRKNAKSSVLYVFILSITDLVMVALVLSGASAATAIGVVGWKGNKHTNWNKICHVYDKFCHRVGGALGTSFVAVIIFIILTLMSLSTLYRRTK